MANPSPSLGPAERERLKRRADYLADRLRQGQAGVLGQVIAEAEFKVLALEEKVGALEEAAKPREIEPVVTIEAGEKVRYESGSAPQGEAPQQGSADGPGDPRADVSDVIGGVGPVGLPSDGAAPLQELQVVFASDGTVRGVRYATGVPAYIVEGEDGLVPEHAPHSVHRYVLAAPQPVQQEGERCTICRYPLYDLPRTGDGDGTGNRFAHSECWNLREAQERIRSLEGQTGVMAIANKNVLDEILALCTELGWRVGDRVTDFIRSRCSAPSIMDRLRVEPVAVPQVAERDAERERLAEDLEADARLIDDFRVQSTEPVRLTQTALNVIRLHLDVAARLLRTPSPAAPVIDVVAAVRRKDGKYWLCRRDASGEHGGLAGMWEYPGGKVEAGEQLKDALRREMNEEFGVNATIGRVLDSIDNCTADATGSKVYRVTFFEASWDEPEELRKHTEARWMTPAEACAVEHLASGTVFNARHLAPAAQVGMSREEAIELMSELEAALMYDEEGEDEESNSGAKLALARTRLLDRLMATPQPLTEDDAADLIHQLEFGPNAPKPEGRDDVAILPRRALIRALAGVAAPPTNPELADDELVGGAAPAGDVERRIEVSTCHVSLDALERGSYGVIVPRDSRKEFPVPAVLLLPASADEVES